MDSLINILIQPFLIGVAILLIAYLRQKHSSPSVKGNMVTVQAPTSHKARRAQTAWIIATVILMVPVTIFMIPVLIYTMGSDNNLMVWEPEISASGALFAAILGIYLIIRLVRRRS